MEEDDRARMKQDLSKFWRSDACKQMKDKLEMATSTSEAQHNAKNQSQKETYAGIVKNDEFDVANYQDLEGEEPRVSKLYKTNCSPSPTQSNRELSSREYEQETRNSGNRHKSPDSDDIFDKPNNNANVKQSKNQSKPSNSHTYQYINMQFENEQRNRWKIDPLSTSVSEGDIPLHEPERRPSQERPPFGLCKEMQTAETRHRTMQNVGIHLKNMADLWRKWHRNEDSNVQWGSPIQVGTVNGSPDKSRLSVSPEPDDQQNKTEETGKESHDRAWKRKASIAIAMMQQTSSSDEDEESSSFVTPKKKKKRKSQLTNKTKIQHSNNEVDEEEENIVSHSKSNEREREIEVVKNKNETRVDDSNVMKLRRRSRTPPEPRAVSPEPSISYPRRIIPPNPKKYTKKQKNRNTNTPSISSDFLQDLSDSNENEDIVEIKENDSAKAKEIKPLPIKNISDRLKRQCMRLKEISIERSNQATQSSELEKENEDKRMKREAYERRMREINEIRKREEEMQRKAKEKGERYNKILNLKQKESKGRSLRYRKEEEEKREEENLLQDNDDLRIIEQITDNDVEDNVSCPICNEPFPYDKIESHAAQCERYNYDVHEDEFLPKKEETAPTRKNAKYNKIVHECNVCSSFKTDNGIEYEDHVNECLERHRREQERSSSMSSSVDTHDIPTSPIRCYRSISEQNDSHINYNNQFATSSNKHSYQTRKRKR